MKNKLLNNTIKKTTAQGLSSTVINIENSEVLDIFGINNENIDFFEKNLPLKIYQKGNQLILQGNKKNIEILKSAINQTISDKKMKKKIKSNVNLMQENLKMFVSNEIKNINITKTIKLDVIGKSKLQNTYLEILKKKQIVFAIGPAGTGKTFLAVAAAVSQLLQNKFDRIILSRPAVEAGEKLGFLPGDLKDKVDPYLRPLYDSLYDLIPSDIALKKIESSEIEIAPLAFMRGRTLKNSFAILDEAQNATLTQIKMFLTRIGENSKIVVNGDPSQIDLINKSQSGLIKSKKILNKIKEIKLIEFDHKDVVRHALVTKIIQAFNKFDDKS